ncbi:hypothetical protein AOLI_G00227510 [Acnodon oligacanthus]
MPARSTSPAPWLTGFLRSNWQELRKAESTWRKSQIDSDLHSYLSLLSKFSLEVTAAKSSFYREKLETSESNPHAVLQLIKSSNPTTCPLDPIPSALFQSISKDLLPFITFLINKSLSSGEVPSTFKTTRVFPILKKPTLDSSDANKYRLVSLLSFLSKILEHAVCHQLSLFLTQNQLQDPNQSGFKPAHSTETALIRVT